MAAARRATEMTKRRFVAEGRRDPSTPELEASAVASVHGHKTEETAGGGEELETDTEVGSTEEERDEAHAIRTGKGQGTSMPTQELREANADDGRMAPWRKPTGMISASKSARCSGCTQGG